MDLVVLALRTDASPMLLAECSLDLKAGM